MNIVDTFKEVNPYVNPTYIRENNVKLFLGRYGHINITVLNNAMRSGKTCNSYTLERNRFDYNYEGYDALQKLLEDMEISFTELVYQLETKRFVAPEGYQLIVDETKSINTYSPFAEINKVKIDNKLTPLKLAKAIICGQVSKIICKGHYTDDYAYDAAVGFHIGHEKNQDELAENIISSRGQGWWIDIVDGCISINCGQFLYYDVVFK